MPETNTNSAIKKLAVVTGAGQGLGLAICGQLATVDGITVVLTARDEKKGVEAVEKLKGSKGLSNVVFHQLDVNDPASVASLADFIKTKFGKLDILVNNAGVYGFVIDDDGIRTLKSLMDANAPIQLRIDKYKELASQTPEMAEECVQTNYYGTKRVTEALLPLLQLSDSPRIVNVSAVLAKLEYVSDTWAQETLSNEDGLTEERVEDVLNKHIKNFKETKGWPALTMAKAAMNAYTRILAKKFPKFRINCICPGYVKTDSSYHTGALTAEEAAAGPVKLALFPDDGPSGLFFVDNEVSSF